MLDYVYHDLNDEDRVIFEHRLGYNGKKKIDNTLIAEKIKKPPKYISTRSNYIQEKINKAIGWGVE
jgi:hypothetical protein